MKSGYNVVKNFLYMIFSNTVTRVLSLVTVIYLANVLGPQDFGKLNWAIVFVSYFAVIADFGASINAARDLSSDKSRLPSLLGKVIGFKLVFGLIAFAACLSAALILRLKTDDFILVLALSMTIFSSVTFFLAWVFQGIEDMKHLGYSLILQSFVYICLVLGFAAKDVKLHTLALMILCSQTAAVIYQFICLRKICPACSLSLDFSDIRATAAKTAHITWSHFMLILGQNSPLFLIGLFSSASAAGFFAASQKISTLFWEIISNFSGALFPALSRNFSKDHKKFSKMANYALKLIFTALAPVLVLIAVLSYSITQFIYGNAFIESYWTLKILIFLPLFMFLDSLASNILIISGRQKYTSFIKTSVTSSAFILSALAAKKAGINAVAAIFTLSFFISAIWQYKKVSDLLEIDWKNCVILPIFFSALAGAVVFYIKIWSLPLAFIIAAAGYTAMIHFYGLFNMEEKEYLKDSLKNLRSRFFNMEF